MNDKDKSNTGNDEKLVAMSVRFSPEVMNVINEVSRLNHLSKRQKG